MRAFLIPFILLSIILCGCSKAKSPRWLVVDLSVRSAYDGSPIKSKVVLKYTEVTIFGSYPVKKELGYTDEEGHLEIEESVSRKSAGFTLDLYAQKAGYKHTYGLPSHTVQGLIKKHKNVTVALVEPKYTYWLSVKNANCYNELDTAWIQWETYSGVYTGCADVDGHTGIYPPVQFTPDLNFNIKVKRNGVITNFQKSFTLQVGPTQDILLEY